MKKAILVVSFGTTYDTTRKNTIGAIENKIKEEFCDYEVKRAFTSSIIIKKLRERNIEIYNVEEALYNLSDYDEVIVQPTHIIQGFEYEKIINACKKYKNVALCNALLYNDNDYEMVASFINSEFSSYNGTVIMMGHGTEHSSDFAYEKLQKLLNKNIFIATVEGEITLDNIIPKIESENVLLTPFMVVCGDHANNDLSVGWKEVL
ncbi:MAG: sirohydrochlorin cobaltochelatase, partial [Lachnospirales bacterium]